MDDPKGYHCAWNQSDSIPQSRRVSGLDRYRRLWKKEIGRKTSTNLESVVGNWSDLENAFKLRHQLIHGAQGSTGADYARTRVEQMLKTSKGTGVRYRKWRERLCSIARAPLTCVVFLKELAADDSQRRVMKT
jgi:hypothetical protein